MVDSLPVVVGLQLWSVAYGVFFVLGDRVGVKTIGGWFLLTQVDLFRPLVWHGGL